MESSAVSTPNNLYSSGSLCLICGKSFIFMEINSSGETILNKQGFKRKLRVTDENSQKYFEVLQERLDIKKERAARNGICTKCMVKIDSVLRMRKESERLTNELESLRKATKERSLKDESPKGNSQFTATSSSSSSTDARPVEIRRKRLLRSPQFPPAKIKYQAIRPKPVMFDESKKDKKSLKEDSINNNSDKEKGAPVDDTDDLRPRDKTNEMKQINVEDHEAELNNGCKSLHTVTDHPPLVRIESVKIEAVDLESNTNLLENTMRNPRRDIPKSRDKENNRSKVVNKNDVKLLSCKSDSTSSDNITFSAKTGTEVMTDCIGFINPPLKDLESNGNVVENINAKKDQALYNDILKSNVNSFKRKNSNTDPLDSKNGSHDENLKARGAETNDSKTDIKCVDISQYSVNGKAESSNSSVDTGVRHTDSSSLTKYTGAIQTEYLPSSSSKSASDSDHEEINKPFAGIANDPISTSISTNQNLRKLLDKRLDDAKRDSDSRQIKRKGEPSKHSLEKRNCSSLDRLTRMCEQDDPTDNKNYITDELMIPDISPEHLPVESKEINKNKTMPMKVSEAQQTPRSLMDNERPLHEYPHWLDQTRAIPHIHGKMHSGFSFRRDHFRFNEGHSHFRYMIPDHVLPPPFYISNGYNHNLPQQVQFQHGSSTDRPVTDQDYPRKVMYHEEMSHSSKMSLIESDKACGEAEHAAKIKLVAAELEVVGLQKVYWKKRLKQIQDKDSDHNEEL